MLWISASIFDKGTTPPQLLGQFMPIMSRNELLCSLNIASRQQFLWTMPVYAAGTHTVHVILLSQLVWVKGLEPPVRIPLCYWIQRTIFKIVAKQMHTGFELLFCGIVAAQAPLNSTTLECMLPHFSHWWNSSFFGCASTLMEHINHAPREVTVNEVPTVADKMKLEHWFPWVLLRCPSGRAPSFYKTPIVQTRNPQTLSTPTAWTY